MQTNRLATDTGSCTEVKYSYHFSARICRVCSWTNKGFDASDLRDVARCYAERGTLVFVSRMCHRDCSIRDAQLLYVWVCAGYEVGYGGLHQKSWECQDSSDNALHTKLGPPSESRVRAGPRTIDADLRTVRYSYLPNVLAALAQKSSATVAPGEPLARSLF